MTQIFFTKAGQRPSLFASLGLVVVILAGIALLLAGPILGYVQQASGTPEQVFQWRLKVYPLVGLLLLGGGGLTFIGILHGRFSSRVRTSWRGFLAVLLATSIALPLWFIDQAKRNTPQLHDIATDIADPPYFRHLRERSYLTDRAADFLGGRLDPDYATLHRTAYPDIASLQVNVSVPIVLETIEHLITLRGWTLENTDPAYGQIEASITDPWLQLRSIVVVRVRSSDAGTGSIVDIRAVSELGVSDFGMNARLIRGLIDDINKETT